MKPQTDSQSSIQGTVGSLGTPIFNSQSTPQGLIGSFDTPIFNNPITNSLKIDPSFIDFLRHKPLEFGVVNTSIDGDLVLELKTQRKYLVFHALNGADNTYSIGGYDVTTGQSESIGSDGTTGVLPTALIATGGATAVVKETVNNRIILDIDNPSTINLIIFYIALT